jgi:hypothetical protein
MQRATSADAYPLAWPQGWDRTPRHRRSSGAWRSNSFYIVRRALENEIARLGGRYAVISTNALVRQDGAPYASEIGKVHDDPGVAVYFERKEKQMVFACDTYDRIWKNMRAITKTIEAIRGIERWGASDMLERSLSAFQALPPPESWRAVFGLYVEPTLQQNRQRRGIVLWRRKRTSNARSRARSLRRCVSEPLNAQKRSF